MKVKQFREDFVVREQTHFRLENAWKKSAGEHAVYELEKCGLATLEVLQLVARHWNLNPRSISHGGLKDRHALTTQWISIQNGPRQDLTEPGFRLRYLGTSRRAYTAKDIAANAFEIVLRDLPPSAAEHVASQAKLLTSTTPNYFDDQRFGSLGESGQFIALPWCLGDYERALYLAIAEANPHDRPRQREQKQILRDHWGDWTTCKERLERSNARSIVTYLVDHPYGFKKAVALIRRDLRSLYVSAFQSKLWNELVCRRLAELIPADQRVMCQGAAGPLLFPQQPAPELFQPLADRQIPLPSNRTKHWPSDLRHLLDEILAEMGIKLHQLRFSHPRDVFFSRAERTILLQPTELTADVQLDDRNGTERNCVRLKFNLPPGQYATMLIRAIQLDFNSDSNRAH